MNAEIPTPRIDTSNTNDQDPAFIPGTDEYAARKREEMPARLAGEAEGMITMPESVSAPLDAMREERAAEAQAAAEEAKTQARSVAEEINATRPEGMPSSLPADEEPVSGELTASTVRSYKNGIGGPQN